MVRLDFPFLDLPTDYSTGERSPVSTRFQNVSRAPTSARLMS